MRQNGNRLEIFMFFVYMGNQKQILLYVFIKKIPVNMIGVLCYIKHPHKRLFLFYSLSYTCYKLLKINS